MSQSRKAHPSDVSDDEWALVAPYLTLVREDAGQRAHPLREVFNGLRYVVKTGAPWRWMPHDLPPWAAVYTASSSAKPAKIATGSVEVIMRIPRPDQARACPYKMVTVPALKANAPRVV